MIIVLNWLILIMTFGLVQIADVEYYDNDTAIVELNNYTLNDIFASNNLLDDPQYNNWYFTPSPIANTKASNYNTFTPTQYNHRMERDITITSGDTIYHGANVRTTDNKVRIAGRVGVYDDYHTGSGEIEYISTKAVVPHTKEYPRIATYNTSTYSLIEVFDYFVINLTDYGIENVSLNDLDYYYYMYSHNLVYDYDYTLNTLDMTHVTIIVGSFFLWTWLYKFLKGVVL
jgi:hypothetical protein